jgi:tetratricopeptide (TPR) repeat protein
VGRESRRKKESDGRGSGAGKGSRGEAFAARPPLVDPRAIEKTMAAIHRLIEDQDFKDLDEANRFISAIMAETGGHIHESEPRTPLEEAQNLMYQAWDATGARRVQLARKALEISPDCADAYVMLAEAKARNLEEARDFFAQGVAAGERTLGPEAFAEDVGHFWGLMETRPYMRAREGLAQCLWALGERKAAIDHLKDMLRLNPGDNQGVRYVLLDWLLAAGRDGEAEELLAQFEDDPSAAILYSHALLMFRREGDSPASRRLLKEAVAGNRHVPAFLLVRKHLPSQLPDSVGFEDESEAVCYVADALANWQATDGALTWLAGAV